MDAVAWLVYEYNVFIFYATGFHLLQADLFSLSALNSAKITDEQSLY